MNSSLPTNRNTQQGAVLIVSLIILVLMTIIGVSAIKTTTLEERMVGNMRDQDLAFQSAEAAVIEGENYLENTVLIVTDGSAGIHDKGTLIDQFPFYADTWTDNTKSIPATVSINNEENVPRYYIEKLGDVSKSTGRDLTFDPGGSKAKGGDITGYKVVAMGRGPSGTAQSIVASYYGKKEFQ